MTEWKRVYQGGHHDIWCDGERHKCTEGGYTSHDNHSPLDGWQTRRDYKCDCAYWREFWDKVGSA
jgi:hypothetical protein